MFTSVFGKMESSKQISSWYPCLSPPLKLPKVTKLQEVVPLVLKCSFTLNEARLAWSSRTHTACHLDSKYTISGSWLYFGLNYSQVSLYQQIARLTKVGPVLWAQAAQRLLVPWRARAYLTLTLLLANLWRRAFWKRYKQLSLFLAFWRAH